MHAAVCRGLAVAAVAASLGAVLVSPAISYADDPAPTPSATATATPVDPVTDVLNHLDAGDTVGLGAAVAALTPAQVATLLHSVSAGHLAAVTAVLSPAQISELGISAVTGLQALVTDLGAAPTAAQVNALVAQVNALLAATAPKDLGRLNGLLTQFAPLLTTAGLDLAGLGELARQVAAVAFLPNAPSALVTIITVLVTGSTKAPTPTATPTVAVPTPMPVVTPPPFTAFRVTVVRAKTSSDGRHAYVVLRCPASVDAAIADLSGTRGEQPAFKPRSVKLAGRTTKVVTVRLARGSGPLNVVATTRGSSLRPSTQRAVL